MESIFKNKFFSVAGQKERLTNVVKTLGAAVLPGGAKVVSTLNPTSKAGKVANKVMEVAAANPFATAAVGAVAAKPKLAVAAVKEVTQKATNLIKKSPTTSSVGAATATTVAQKITQPSNVIVAGQPAGSPTVLIPGQSPSSTNYVIPSSSPGGTPGSVDLGIGGGESSKYVQDAANGKPQRVASNISNEIGNLTGYETPTTMEELIAGSPTSQNNNMKKFMKRQKLTTPTINKLGKARKTSKSTHKKGKSRVRKSSRKFPYHKKGHFGTAKQFKKKGGFKVHTAKNGAKYIILKSGKARFVKK